MLSTKEHQRVHKIRRTAVQMVSLEQRFHNLKKKIAFKKCFLPISSHLLSDVIKIFIVYSQIIFVSSALWVWAQLLV